jgi:hypothetical protein
MAALRPQVSCTRCQMGTRSHEHPPTAAPLRPPSGSRWRHPCRSSGPSSLQRRLFCDRSTLWMGPVLGPPAGALYCTFNALLSTTPVWYSMRLCPYRRSTLFVIKRQGILDFLLFFLLLLLGRKNSDAFRSDLKPSAGAPSVFGRFSPSPIFSPICGRTTWFAVRTLISAPFCRGVHAKARKR